MRCTLIAASVAATEDFCLLQVGAKLRLRGVGDTFTIPIERPDRQSLLQLTEVRGPAAVGAQPKQHFEGQIRVGTPQRLFTVAFDTGGSTLVLPSIQCEGSGCTEKAANAHAYNSGHSDTAVADGTTATVKFGYGEVTGPVVHDVVCLGAGQGPCANTGILEAKSMDRGIFSALETDGIMGLGLKDPDQGTKMAYVASLVQSKSLKNAQFAIWVADQDDEDKSEITFGGISEKRLGGTLGWHPVAPGSNNWQVALSSIRIDGSASGACPSNQCLVAFDTGTPEFTASPDVIDAIRVKLNLDESCENYDTLPTMGFQLGRYVYNLGKEQYVKRTERGCHLKMVAHDAGEQHRIYSVGDDFLSRFYTVYDWTSQTVGLGLAAHKNAASSDAIEIL
mmetsp:Transcript_35250/g.77125  ORF Transcript_35250/g.77125 Transcript_35250/m.77125 type:complete len:393 (+) Transcript_35250:89-1267(+)|eukprot:CAMPEP_0204269550 /NCGR_PEP_ID=MMETSP0468-20130131/16431_1 /ASSEMBLY_ACC=CAM_ASM_000383 /TAXON_ID=2969 /ORGANISM="Oxyrrhis marina" /LENGTH=392 /DNA_ID=CAMNT_0051244951 /DNA_START=70 /DNA_END=1248 /DNA_ORIENTATION=-